MNINLIQLKKNEPLKDFSGLVPTELEEIGCQGQLNISFKSTQIQENYWVSVRAVVGFSFECKGCGSPLSGEVVVEPKVMLQNGPEIGIRWSEEDSGNFDEYWAEIGPDVEEIPILSLIREQVLLNCNSAKPEEGQNVSSCEVCKNESSKLKNKKVQNEKKEIDPRWEKLKGLLNKEDN